ncbi:MAG: hypothetical protein RL732_1580 [Bacteroidota bacterium]
MRLRNFLILSEFLLPFLLLAFLPGKSLCSDTTFAERLGFPSGSRVVILHVDDAGMSWDSNEGAIRSLTQGVANSCSVMMPCPWVPAFTHFLSEHPTIDAGLHLTLTSEWKGYRWAPLSGVQKVPGLVDGEGAFWSEVDSVVKHASPDEVEMEIRAQVERALKIGFRPTHLDSHMGTLFASIPFLQRYMKVGMEYDIPVMFPAGHTTLIREQMQLPDMMVKVMQGMGRKLWDAGLPVLDDLHNTSYDWKLPDGSQQSDKALQRYKTKKYSEALRSLKPGVTMMIMHCTYPTEVFSYISDSGPTRKGDMLAMTDPLFRKALEEEKIILTTWRELKERRMRQR